METLPIVLAIGTLGFVAAFAYVSARTLEKKRDEDTPRSTLCASSPHWQKAQAK